MSILDDINIVSDNLDKAILEWDVGRWGPSNTSFFKEPIAYLRHEYTGINISVYKEIPKLQRWFLKKCFGLTYDKFK